MCVSSLSIIFLTAVVRVVFTLIFVTTCHNIDMYSNNLSFQIRNPSGMPYLCSQANPGRGFWFQWCCDVQGVQRSNHISPALCLSWPWNWTGMISIFIHNGKSKKCFVWYYNLGRGVTKYRAMKFCYIKTWLCIYEVKNCLEISGHNGYI